MTRKNRFRALRNLIVAAVLLLATWLISGAPLPTTTMRMHREERLNLAEQSQIVWRHEDMRVGLTPTSVHTYNWRLEVWARDPDGPTLVPLPSYLSYTAGVGGTYGLLAVDPPAGAMVAHLTVTMESPYYVEGGHSEEYQAWGARDGECFLFRLIGHHMDPFDSLNRWEFGTFLNHALIPDAEGYFTMLYTLEFFDGDGNLILSCGNQP